MKTKQNNPVISAEGVRKIMKTLNIAFPLILEACLCTASIRKYMCIQCTVYCRVGTRDVVQCPLNDSTQVLYSL